MQDTGLSTKRMLNVLVSIICVSSLGAFSPSFSQKNNIHQLTELNAKKGFVTSTGFGAGGSSSGSSKKKKKKQSLMDTLADKPRKEASVSQPFVNSEQDQLLESLAAKAANTCIGRAVASSPMSPEEMDPFWQLMPALIDSRFPDVPDKQLERVAGMIRHTLDPNLPLEEAIINDPHRPHDEIHAYMPGLGQTKPFHDPSQLRLCKMLSDNYDTICAEYHALLEDKKDRFQSVTSMNYDSGWKTLVLFYNGHRIPDFPYHLAPMTTKLLETEVPLGGRIAGFNRQQPQSGIPLHTDGNNMWLTCQMGVHVPEGETASIRVGPETRHWKEGECLLYDTTYEHETKNEHPTQERVVLHVDFFNTLAMTPIEIEIMQYIYSLREEFMKAEGVAKVGAQIL